MGNQRYYSLDALRGVMLLPGIVLHGVFFYLIKFLILTFLPSVNCYYPYLLLARRTWSALLNGNRFDATGRMLAVSVS